VLPRLRLDGKTLAVSEAPVFGSCRVFLETTSPPDRASPFLIRIEAAQDQSVLAAMIMAECAFAT
jgi:hypothetical protein